MSEPELTNKYRDNLKIDALRVDLDALKVDVTNFVGALLQSGVTRLRAQPLRLMFSNGYAKLVFLLNA
jgi:hypothetical protein